MEIMARITKAPWDRAAVAIGKFEGLHIGHQKLIRKIVEKQRAGFVPVAFTFDVSPRIYFGQGRGMLFTKEERRTLFRNWGVGCLLEYPFTKELAAMDAEDFVERILIEKLHTGYLAVGRDFRFGRERRGSTALLQSYEKQGAFELEIIEKEFCGVFEVSSTRIRDCLKEGRLEEAGDMLGFPFFIEGTVVEGNRLGRTWGIPTANILLDRQKLLPPNGVYLSRVSVEGKVYPAITNLGTKPTIGDSYARGAETYIYDFDRNIYGKNIVLELLLFHRKERKFDSVERLVEQLKSDVERGCTYFTNLQKFQENPLTNIKEML